MTFSIAKQWRTTILVGLLFTATADAQWTHSGQTATSPLASDDESGVSLQISVVKRGHAYDDRDRIIFRFSKDLPGNDGRNAHIGVTFRSGSESDQQSDQGQGCLEGEWVHLVRRSADDSYQNVYNYEARGGSVPYVSVGAIRTNHEMIVKIFKNFYENDRREHACITVSLMGSQAAMAQAGIVDLEAIRKRREWLQRLQNRPSCQDLYEDMQSAMVAAIERPSHFTEKAYRDAVDRYYRRCQ